MYLVDAATTDTDTDTRVLCPCFLFPLPIIYLERDSLAATSTFTKCFA